MPREVSASRIAAWAVAQATGALSMECPMQFRYHSETPARVGAVTAIASGSPHPAP
ncbi:hypothetical protein [Paracoccus zhejiangensis]|uniref:hypothetical protein n=1 Tax=Paracoccus zhejiangensis TaxID=1077935 RepID=UPI0012FFDAF4|nr:hypothetical protein [Paracoccus zhejiangensis]